MYSLVVVVVLIRYFLPFGMRMSNMSGSHYQCNMIVIIPSFFLMLS